MRVGSLALRLRHTVAVGKVREETYRIGFGAGNLTACAAAARRMASAGTDGVGGGDTTVAPSGAELKKKKKGMLQEEAMFDWSSVEGTLHGTRLVDIGANLADSCFDADRDDVLRRAAAHGKVAAIVITGTSIRQSRQALEIAAAASAAMEEEGAHADGCAQPPPRLFATAGVHPHDVKSLEGDDGVDEGERGLDAIAQLIRHPNCVAVGECGLDYNRDFSPRDVQRKWFEAQVRLAVEHQRPLFVHCREANDDLCSIIEKVARDVSAAPGTHAIELPVAIVVHCFTGTVDEARRLLALGCHIGFTGWICDEREGRAEQMAEVIREIPDDRIMIETDAPYLPPRRIRPSKLRPRRNEPCLLPHVLATVAEVRDQSIQHVARITTENALRFFGIE